MSAWPGKFVIGLTGNIGTGKSVVRKMLEHLGAYGIDADALANRAIAKGSPGYQPVVDLFGKWILDADDQIDRAKLGRLVFSDPDALESLEKIVHPLVGQAMDILIRRSQQEVVVIEAIKLIEAGLAKKCNSLWVTYAPQEQQVARLVQKRGMSEASATQRIQAQPPQEDKVIAANVVIRNDRNFRKHLDAGRDRPGTISSRQLRLSQSKKLPQAPARWWFTALGHGRPKRSPC